MNKPRTEIKVGVFVILGLVLAAAVIIQFNKSAGPLTPMYRLHLNATNVAGVFPGSSIMMAGVPIGSVEEIELITLEGSTVIHTKLLKKYPIRTNSVFVIRQSGFLGDQYIGVIQGSSDVSTYFQDGDFAECKPSFDFGETAKTATGLLESLNGLVAQVSNAVQRVDTTLLSQQSLTNLTETVGNLRSVSERTLSAIGKIEQLLDTNSPALSLSVSNAQAFTVHLNELAVELRETLATNRHHLTASLANIEKSSANLDLAMTELNAGRGMAGALLKNDQLAIDLSLIVSNMQVLSSNINNKGLWGVIRKPKIPSKGK